MKTVRPGTPRPASATRASQPAALHTQLRALIEEALRAQPHRAHIPNGASEPTAYIAQPVTKGLLACLSSENLPSLFDAEGRLVRIPRGTVAASSAKLEAGIIAGSRVAEAGAHLIVFPASEGAHPVGASGVVAMERKPGRFRTIEAAEFASVGDDVDLAGTSLPVSAADIDMSQAITQGLRIELPYRMRKDVEPDILCAEVVAALTLGLARAADHVLLAAIAATTPGVFSLASAAAQGVAFNELRSLVGTAGVGAAVAPDGTLRAHGIPAELTADTADTIIGAWNRAAIAISEDVDVLFERTNTRGDLSVTVWSHFLPLLPDAGKFWTADAVGA